MTLSENDFAASPSFINAKPLSFDVLSLFNVFISILFIFLYVLYYFQQLNIKIRSAFISLLLSNVWRLSKSSSCTLVCLCYNNNTHTYYTSLSPCDIILSSPLHGSSTTLNYINYMYIGRKSHKNTALFL